jgi:periplasmic mercuric ion binding protein
MFMLAFTIIMRKPMKALVAVLLFALAPVALAPLPFAPLAFAQETQEAQFKVYGNCGMCKTRIEKAASVKEVRYAKWNKSTKMLSVAFAVPGMTADSLQRRIAAVGHDTDTYKAPDSVYAALPACCLYRGTSTTH